MLRRPRDVTPGIARWALSIHCAKQVMLGGKALLLGQLLQKLLHLLSHPEEAQELVATAPSLPPQCVAAPQSTPLLPPASGNSMQTASNPSAAQPGAGASLSAPTAGPFSEAAMPAELKPVAMTAPSHQQAGTAGIPDALAHHKASFSSIPLEPKSEAPSLGSNKPQMQPPAASSEAAADAKPVPTAATSQPVITSATPDFVASQGVSGSLRPVATNAEAQPMQLQQSQSRPSAACSVTPADAKPLPEAAPSQQPGSAAVPGLDAAQECELGMPPTDLTPEVLPCQTQRMRGKPSTAGTSLLAGVLPAARPSKRRREKLEGPSSAPEEPRRTENGAEQPQGRSRRGRLEAAHDSHAGGIIRLHVHAPSSMHDRHSRLPASNLP